MNIFIDFMSAEDIDSVLEISSLSFSSPWSRESYIKELANPIATYFVAKFDNKVVGFIGTWIVLDESDITNVAVHPDYRNKGIASKLIENLIKYCREQKCTSFILEVRCSNNSAISIYEKHDFVREGIRKGYYEDNKEDAILMRLKE